jgi:hypothetical protein
LAAITEISKDARLGANNMPAIEKAVIFALPTGLGVEESLHLQIEMSGLWHHRQTKKLVVRIGLRLIIANASFQSILVTSIPGASTGGTSMPHDRFVYKNFLTIFVHLDDRITPTQLRFNMSQLVHNFRPV